MKVIQINAVYKTSSTGRTTFEMHKALQEKGIDSYVFCCNSSIPSDKVFRVGNILDHKLHAINSRIFGLQGYFSVIATLALINKMEKISPDIVILRNLHNNYLNVPMLLNFLSKKKCGVIDVLHDCWSFTGHCCYYTEDNCNKWQSECNTCQLLNKGNKSLFFDNSSRIFRMKQNYFNSIQRLAVIGVSKWISNESKKSPVFSNAIIKKHIYNWINLDVFKPQDTTQLRSNLNIEEKQFVAIGVSQVWSRRKGLYHFISVASKMPNIIFVLVGSMPASINLPKNIISIPRTSSVEELCQYYSMADVFLNFSVQETFGKVTAEALACGTPLIVNDTTATPELCGEGCGYIIHDNNEDDVILAIEQIRINGKELYSSKCRSFAIDNFEMNKGIDNYVQVFNELCD